MLLLDGVSYYPFFTHVDRSNTFFLTSIHFTLSHTRASLSYLSFLFQFIYTTVLGHARLSFAESSPFIYILYFASAVTQFSLGRRFSPATIFRVINFV